MAAACAGDQGALAPAYPRGPRPSSQLLLCTPGWPSGVVPQQGTPSPPRKARGPVLQTKGRLPEASKEPLSADHPSRGPTPGYGPQPRRTWSHRLPPQPQSSAPSLRGPGVGAVQTWLSWVAGRLSVSAWVSPSKERGWPKGGMVRVCYCCLLERRVPGPTNDGLRGWGTRRGAPAPRCRPSLLLHGDGMGHEPRALLEPAGGSRCSDWSWPAAGRLAALAAPSRDRVLCPTAGTGDSGAKGCAVGKHGREPRASVSGAPVAASSVSSGSSRRAMAVAPDKPRSVGGCPTSTARAAVQRRAERMRGPAPSGRAMTPSARAARLPGAGGPAPTSLGPAPRAPAARASLLRRQRLGPGVGLLPHERGWKALLVSPGLRADL